MEEDGPQVIVKFTTKDSSIRVTEKPIAVPTRLNRPHLSKIINHLLHPTKPILFDFLIDGKFLRTSLSSYLRKNLLSEEMTLTLEYIQAMPEPTLLKEKDHSDWISAVSAGNSNIVSTGSYDGTLRVYDVETSECKALVQAHDGAIKDVYLEFNTPNSVYHIATCGKDHTAKLWTYDQRTNELTNYKILTGHLNSVDAVRSKLNQIITAGWDNTVRLWNTKSQSAQSHKKQKLSEDGDSVDDPFTPHSTSEDIFMGHTSAITSVSFHPTQTERIVSASLDRSIRMWDSNTQDCIQTIHTNSAISDMSVHAASGMILTAHPDHCVRLWDPRAPEKKESANQQTFVSHQSWVSAVEWNSEQDELFASCAYDGIVKIWDVRCTIPIHSIQAHEGKAFDLAHAQSRTNPASDSIKLVSGGEDRRLKIFHVKR